MIFKKLSAGRMLSIICLVFLHMGISCNKNPVGENFGEDLKNIHKYYNLENLLTIGQDTSGRMYFVDSGNAAVYTYDSTLKYARDSSKTDSMFNYNRGLLIKDKNGTLLFLSDSNICRIKSSGDSFDVDTIGSFSYITENIDGRYSVDDSGNVWFFDIYDERMFDYSTLLFQKWDGERLQSFIVEFSDSLKSSKSKNLRLAAGTDDVFLLHIQVDYPESYDCSLICKRWDKIKKQVTRSASYWYVTTNFESAFVASQKLYVLYHEHNRWSSRVYLEELFDTLYTPDVCIGDSTSIFRLLKRNADEVLLYSHSKIVRITDQISEKQLYSDCGALFLDTLNQIILYDRYRKKFINVSGLPGF